MRFKIHSMNNIINASLDFVEANFPGDFSLESVDEGNEVIMHNVLQMRDFRKRLTLPERQAMDELLDTFKNDAGLTKAQKRDIHTTAQSFSIDGIVKLSAQETKDMLDMLVTFAGLDPARLPEILS